MNPLRHPRSKPIKAAGGPMEALRADPKRLKLRDRFFETEINGRQFLEPFNRFPDALYFVKDAESRMIAVSPGVVTRMRYHSTDEIIGFLPHEYLPAQLANKFLHDDSLVIR